MKQHVLGLAGIALTSWLGYAWIPSEVEASEAESLATAEAVDIALDFVPGVNVVKDLLCLSLGVNPVTGESVGDRETALLVGCIVFPYASRRAAKAIEPHKAGWLARLKPRWWPQALPFSRKKVIKTRHFAGL